MTATRIIVALVLLVGATSTASAQSQRNFGPNGPSRSDCYGEPYSGAVASRCPGEGGYWRPARRYHRYY
jgi:hypothetical protein